MALTNLKPAAPAAADKPVRSAPYNPAQAMRDRQAAIAAGRTPPERPGVLTAYRREPEARRTSAGSKLKSRR